METERPKAVRYMCDHEDLQTHKQYIDYFGDSEHEAYMTHGENEFKHDSSHIAGIAADGEIVWQSWWCPRSRDTGGAPQ